LHLDDPNVHGAAIKALTYPTIAYKEGFVPPGANWAAAGALGHQAGKEHYTPPPTPHQSR
jgi:hypothetical protein